MRLLSPPLCMPLLPELHSAACFKCNVLSAAPSPSCCLDLGVPWAVPAAVSSLSVCLSVCLSVWRSRCPVSEDLQEDPQGSSGI
ncbi:hypothetical protein XELAEV_18001661mg [Xenopus laevis]|uniref:Uncharacterized protein n=1 Tax=Xenopus laevis TaxID=8355 RepID=A0A974BPQ5_XENLA|nr:hypothetical protein XELAEV_18001661mg [Xenopus laevis]